MIEAELADGTILEFPDGTPTGVIQAAVKRMTLGGSSAVPSAPISQPEMSWGEVGKGALVNAIPSTVNLIKGTAEALMSPVETAKSVIDIGAGALQAALPKTLVDFVNEISPSESAAESRKKAALVGAHFADRYGSIEGFKKALATDPAGIAADATTVLSGGAGLASKAGMVKTADVLTKASRAVDPVLQSVRGAEKIVRPVGRVAADVIGGIGTHTGGESIRQMAQAGFEGGQRASTAAAQMRGTAPITDILDEANRALQQIKTQRSAEYTNTMRQVAADKTVLPFNSIDNAVNSALQVKQFKGKSISPTTAKVQQDIVKLVDDWKQQNPADFHTAEGLDALKQAIGDIRDATEYGSPSRKVADSVYNSVKSEIVKQAPDYAKAMAKYSEASELISEIQRHLLGKEKGSPVTAVRKLQNLMSAGGKNKQMEMSLAKELEAAGAKNLLSGLSGVAMQDWAPRLLSGKGMGAGIGTAVVATQNPALALGLLPLQSPRLMGEAALASGRVAGLLGGGVSKMRSNAPGMFDLPLDNYLYQLNVLREQSQEQ